MNTQKGSILNHLLKVWPRGTVAVHPWLRKQGVSRDLAKAYVRSSWINRMGPGAYTRGDCPVDWTGGLFSLQQYLKLPIHAGAITALQLLGYSHFLPLKKGTIHLFGPRNTRLPAWFKDNAWGVTIHFITTTVFPFRNSFGLVEKKVDGYLLRVSSLERAMMEHLFSVPFPGGYEESRRLMDGLVSLRPKVVQALLEHCGSVKTKRLFLALADLSGHRWIKDLNLSQVDLGKGKRVFQKGGRFNTKYQITLPKEDPHA